MVVWVLLSAEKGGGEESTGGWVCSSHHGMLNLAIEPTGNDGVAQQRSLGGRWGGRLENGPHLSAQ